MSVINHTGCNFISIAETGEVLDKSNTDEPEEEEEVGPGPDPEASSAEAPQTESNDHNNNAASPDKLAAAGT